jgi:hypothetical protein
MRVRYVFPLDRPLKLDDHWPVPLLGGECRLVEEDSLVTAIQFTQSGLSTDLSFSIEETPDELSKATITGRDDLLPSVRDHISRAFSYLQCFFNTAISVDEVKVHYEAESPEEEDRIAIPWMHLGQQGERPLPLTYDMVTRALMAAEDGEGPEFISTLATMARESFGKKRYIDSFRFSFLLVESLYGQGKFKSKQLKEAFLTSPELTQSVQKAVAEWKTHTIGTASPTRTLMDRAPAVAEVVDHIINMRGHYFHGNINRHDGWQPAKQEEAEALAWLGVDLVQSIAGEAALPMFADELAKRHFHEAGLAGAHVVMEIEYKFRVPEDDFIRTRKVNFRMPGTKPTTLMAMEAAFQSVQNFRNELPVGRLHSVTGKDTKNESALFSIRFFTEPDGTVVEG